MKKIIHRINRILHRSEMRLYRYYSDNNLLDDYLRKYFSDKFGDL